MQRSSENYSGVLSSIKLKNLVDEWLEEDCPGFDFGACVVGEKPGVAQLLCKSPCVLAGVPFFDGIFSALDCDVTWNYSEGHAFSRPKEGSFCSFTAATVKGKVKNILRGERPALNVLSRASGIALLCNNFMEKAARTGWKGRIAGTRKTTPGFRLVEKYALLVGGADTHRYDLSTMVMLKDNHIWSTGSIKEAVAKVLAAASFAIKVEVECQNLEEGLEAAGSGAHIVMFDNQTPESMHRCAESLKERYPNTTVECSGGINEDNVDQYFSKYVDVISTSRLVQGYPCADFSLKITQDTN